MLLSIHAIHDPSRPELYHIQRETPGRCFTEQAASLYLPGLMGSVSLNSQSQTALRYLNTSPKKNVFLKSWAVLGIFFTNQRGLTESAPQNIWVGC